MRNILVTGASGIVGYGVLRSLRTSGKKLQLIGTTIYDDSVAQGFSDFFELAPLTNDTGYIDWLIRTIEKHNVKMIIPGIEADMYKWIDYIPEIESHGTLILLNNIDLIRLCKDKWEFYKYMQKLNSQFTISTCLSNDFEELKNGLGLPFSLKAKTRFWFQGY